MSVLNLERTPIDEFLFPPLWIAPAILCKAQPMKCW